MMDEQVFQLRCDEAMDDLFEALSDASDDHAFDVDQNNGTVTVEFDEARAKFVVSPNSPVRQIWVSALTKSFKLDWRASEGAFILPESGATLKELMGEAVSTQLGQKISLD